MGAKDAGAGVATSSTAEERNALMANGAKSGAGGGLNGCGGVSTGGGSGPIEPQKETFRTFLYNRHKGTVLGRTAKSWVQILVFYVIFYTCLAAFWLGCLAVFLSTLDDKAPRYHGKGTIIGVNPGVGYQPWIKENPDSTLIRFNLKDADSWRPYANQLKGYLKKYEETNGTRECTGADDGNHQAVKEGSAAEGEEQLGACRFSLDAFSAAGCSAENDYGYKEGKPCVIVSLNRLIGWRPEDYAPGEVPDDVKDRYKPGSIAIHCDGTNGPDKEHLGKVNYLPPEGIDGKYYPYSVLPNYHQPIAMVKFEQLPRNKLVMIECRAFAKNIEQDFTSRLGLVHFELYLQDIAVAPKDL